MIEKVVGWVNSEDGMIYCWAIAVSLLLAETFRGNFLPLILLGIFIGYMSYRRKKGF